MGALLGAVVGDTLGVTYEFGRPEAIPPGRLQMLGGGPFGFEPGVGSDDTDLLFAVLDSYDRSQFDADAALTNMIEWYKTGPLDVGLRTEESLDSWIDLKQPPVDDTALGNGGLMRAAAHGIMASGYQFAQTNAADDTRLTHNAQIAADCSAHQAGMVWRLINTPKISLASIMSTRGVRYRTRIKPYDTYVPEMSGYCVHTLRLAMHALETATSFEEGITNVIRTGGDTDTNGAVAGALLGAKFGEAGIPRDWINHLDPALMARINEYRVKEREVA